MLHDSLSLESPMHALPPLAGAGLEQVRVLGLVPPPHVWEQGPELDHWLQPPSTNKDGTKVISVSAKYPVPVLDHLRPLVSAVLPGILSPLIFT